MLYPRKLVLCCAHALSTAAAEKNYAQAPGGAAAAAADAGAVGALSSLLGTLHNETRSHALGALARICSLVPEVDVPSGVIGPLSSLCRQQQDAPTREAAAAVLAVLAASTADTALPMLRSGAARSDSSAAPQSASTAGARERRGGPPVSGESSLMPSSLSHTQPICAEGVLNPVAPWRAPAAVGGLAR